MRRLLGISAALIFSGSAAFAQQAAPRVSVAGSFNFSPASVAAKSGIFAGLLQNTQSADTYVVTGNPRNVLMSTTLSPSANTNTIWENDNSFVYINGPGQQQGEVNGFHSYFEIESGAVVTVQENFESSNLVNGTLSGGVAFLGNMTNGSAGTIGNYIGLDLNYANNNSTANSVSGYTGFLLNAFTGPKPTSNNTVYAINIKEPTASINTLGGVGIGTASQEPAGYFVLQTPDNSNGTYAFQILNHSGQTLLQMNDAGGILVANGSGGNAGAVSCTGVPTASFAVTNGIVTHC